MYYLGMDIGSVASKACIIDENAKIVATVAVQSGTGSTGPEKAKKEVMDKAGIKEENVKWIVATGYGRLRYENANEQISEISCHAKGINYLIPEARTIIDIGGQDAKAIRIDKDGKIQQFVMNEKCAAGTGRFIEIMARTLEVELSELDNMAFKSTHPANISSTCTVFAESEVISQLSAGAKKEDIVAGIMHSVASRTSGLARRVGLKPTIVFTGGVAKNKGVAKALEDIINVEIAIPEDPQITGALGAALFALVRSTNNKIK